MLDFLFVVLALFITAPIVITVITYYTMKFLYQNGMKAFHKAINWTTILYILAVSAMLSYLFKGTYIGYIVVIMLCILTIIIIFQWKIHSEIDYHKAFKILWRLSFLLFFFLYSVLVLYGIIRGIVI